MNDGDSRRRIVITGLGVVSSIGIGRDEFWTNLIQGRSGISQIESFDPTELSTQQGGELKNFHPQQFIDPRKVNLLDAALNPWLALLGDVVQIDVPPSPQVKALEAEFRPERTADVVLRRAVRLTFRWTAGVRLALRRSAGTGLGRSPGVTVRRAAGACLGRGRVWLRRSAGVALGRASGPPRRRAPAAYNTRPRHSRLQGSSGNPPATP